MAQVRQQGSKNTKNIATKSVTTNRWFIWTIVGIAIILLGTASYIAIVSANDSSNDQAIFLVHHTNPVPAKTKGGVMIPVKK